MKYESKVLENKELTDNIINSIKQYKKEILSEFDNPSTIELISVKIDITNDNVYLTYNDFTEEENKLTEIITNAINIKTELEKELSNEPMDVVKVALLKNKLVELSKEFDMLKTTLNIDYELYDII